MSEYKLGIDTGRVIKIDGNQTVVIYGGKRGRNLGRTFPLDHWFMGSFRDLTTDEYEEYVKKMYTYEDLKDKKIAIHCDTKEKSQKFIDFADKQKRVDVCRYAAEEYRYEENTCYNIDTSLWFGSKSFYEEDNYEIINFDQVDFNDDKKESYKMKYKLIKTLTLNEILKDNPCQPEFEKAVKKFEFFEIQKWTEENEKFIMKQNGWISFLLQKGFIEEVADEYLHEFSGGHEITLSNGTVLIMFIIRDCVGILFRKGDFNRYANDEFRLDEMYNLKTLKIGISNRNITHLNGKEI